MKASSENQLYKRLLGYLKPFLPLYAICSLVNGMALFLVFSSVGVLLREVVGSVSGTDGTGKVWQMVLYLVGIMAFSVISGFALLGFTYIEQKVQANIRSGMMNAYIRGREEAVEKLSHVEVLNRISSDIPACARLTGYYMNGYVFAPILSGSFSLIFLLFVDVRVTLLTFLCAVLNLFVVQIASKKQQKKNKELVAGKSGLVKFMQECVRGSTEIRTYFLWKPFEEKQERQLEEIGRKQLQIGKYRAFRRAVVVIVTDCVTIVSLLLLGGFLAGKGIIAFSDIMLALPLSDQIGQMLVAFGNYHTILRIHAPHMERVFEVLDLQQEEAAEDGEAVNCAGGELCLRDVSFSYPEQAVLEHVTVHIPYGKKVAFVGGSGSGKSTILKLLLGFYKPQEGEVCLGDTPITAFSKAQWRKNFSYMPQDFSFFQMSIRENIGMETKPDTEKIEKLVKSLGAESFILGTGNGYEQTLGQTKESFSGGQLQRIALARGLYRNAPFLLMDEPVSALDTENGEIVKRAIEQYGTDHTVVVVTHRLELTENFDWIYVVEHGRIAEQGTHRELLEKNGRYAGMWKSQMER